MRVADPAAALSFIDQHGIVLVSAKGPAPRLTEAIVGEPIKGSWWGHPQGKLIFAILGAVAASDQVLTCRMVDGKLTLVHRRLWPMLVLLADRFNPEQLARVHEQHTASGKHETIETAFPLWVPAQAIADAASIDHAAALALLGRFLPKQ